MIFGEMRREGRSSCADALLRLSTDGTLTQHIPADTIGHWRDERVTLIQHTCWNTVESKADTGPIYDAEAQLVIVAWARIDNRDELARPLGLRATDPALSDTHFILHSYRLWHEACVHHLIGDFVFVIFDLRAQTLFCGRDHLGVRPFYYDLSEERVLFATSLQVFVVLQRQTLQTSPQWMAEYLTGLSMSFRATPYPNIVKLPPAHCLTVGVHHIHLRRYFQFSPEHTLHLKDSREYVEAYKAQLDIAIQCRLRSAYPIGTELSGGLDSSTITAYAARSLEQPHTRLHAFAFATLEQEPAYIHAVSHAVPLACTHVFARYGLPEDLYQHGILRVLDILGYPQEHGNATSHEPCYRLAETLNIRILLSGFGGDEFVTAPADLVLTELLIQGAYAQLYRHVRGNRLTRLLRVLKRCINHRRQTQRQYNPRFYHAFSQRWPHQLVKPAWVEHFDLYQRYLHTAQFDAGYTSLNAFTLGNRWAPFVPTRLENCTLMAAARHIEYRWPLLDVRLITLFLSIPSTEKYAYGMGRVLHRRAIEDVVPHMVAWKPSKDMGPPMPQDAWAPALPLKIDELHAELAALIEVDKLAAQLEQLPQLRRDKQPARWFQICSNIDNITWLNQWLHHTLS